MTLLDAISLLLTGWTTPEKGEVYQEASRIVRLHASKVYKAEEIKVLEKRLAELKEKA